MHLSLFTFVCIIMAGVFVGAFCAFNATGRLDKIITALKTPWQEEHDKLIATEREHNSARVDNDALRREVQKLNAALQRNDSNRWYNLDTATHLGGYVDAFRVYYLETEKPWGNRRHDREYDVGYTQDHSVALGYVDRFHDTARKSASSSKREYRVESVRVFRLPTGEFVRARAFDILPELQDRSVEEA